MAIFYMNFDMSFHTLHEISTPVMLGNSGKIMIWVFGFEFYAEKEKKNVDDALTKYK